MNYEPASFRDPDARVFKCGGGRILRALSARAAALDDEFRASGLIDELVRDGLMVENARCRDIPVPEGWAAVVESKPVPFPNYPYEWSFGMLQDAALLTLTLTERALQRGAALKDASAYNVFFHGARPVFIDVSSLRSYEDGMPWLAYGQFCDHFLAPLMLEAYKGVPFQPSLRSNLAGFSVSAQLAPLLSLRDLLRPGVMTHVKLRALVDRRTQRLETGMRRQVRHVSLPKQAVLRNIHRLKRLVTTLASRSPSVWADYDRCNTYGARETELKAAFVAAACERVGRGKLAWDVGANTGRYSRILAKHFETVVAMDVDPGAVDRLYRELKANSDDRVILPLVVDLMNPSPAQGWRGMERDDLLGRGRPDFAVYLALIHHICLGQGVPLSAFLDMVRATSKASVVEFVAIDDPMSQAVLATKLETHGDYDLQAFRALVSRGGEILAEEAVSETRALFLLAS